MMDNNISRGVVQVRRIAADGFCVSTTYHNMELRSGAVLRAKRVNGESGTAAPNKIIVGSGTSASSFDNTAFTQILAKTATVVRTGHVLKYSATYEPGEATGVIRELGLFADDTMCNRVVLNPAITKAATEKLELDWYTESVPASVVSEIAAQ